MKRQFLLFTFLLLGLTCYSQKKQKTLGVLIAPNYNRGDLFIDRGITVTSGLFYDHLFTNRFGLNTGLQLSYEKSETNWRNCRDCPEGLEQTNTRYTKLEVPVNLTFCLNPTTEKGFKAYLFSGIILNRLLATRYKAYYTDKVTVSRSNNFAEREWRYLWQDSYMNLGFELRRNIDSKYAMAFGTSAKFRKNFTLNPDPWDLDPFVLNLNLKFGRNL